MNLTSQEIRDLAARVSNLAAVAASEEVAACGNLEIIAAIEAARPYHEHPSLLFPLILEGIAIGRQQDPFQLRA